MTHTDFNLAGKKIIVTGSASGIGAELSSVLKEQQAYVIGLDKSEYSQNIDEFISVDLTSQNSIDEAVSKLPDSIDGLCNVAGLPPTAPIDMVMLVNFIGLKYFTESIDEKLNVNASIVNVASLAGIGWQDSVFNIKQVIASASFDNIAELCEKLEIDDKRSYFFSKECLIAWTILNRWTWRDRGIRMNCVSPGPVETPILGDFVKTLGERAKEDMEVMDRVGTPKDIAPIAAFLCSDLSRWIRGANIPADGGMSAHIAAQMNGL